MNKPLLGFRVLARERKYGKYRTVVETFYISLIRLPLNERLNGANAEMGISVFYVSEDILSSFSRLLDAPSAVSSDRDDSSTRHKSQQ